MKNTSTPILMRITICLALFAGVACEREDGHHHHDEHDDHEYHSVTYWGDQWELTLSFESHSTRIEGNAYLSDGENRPIPADMLSLNLSSTEREEFDSGDFSSEDEGIFPFELHHDGAAEEFRFSGEIEGEEISESFETDAMSIADNPEADGSHFSKERQWLVDVASGQPEIRPVYDSFKAPGRTRVDKSYYVEILAPVAGHTDAGHDSGISVEEGERVSAGDQLAIISPPLNLRDSWVDRNIEYFQAEEDFARAERLKEDNAISSREFEMRKREYEAQKAVFDHFIQADETDAGHHLRIGENSEVEILAPIDGIVGSLEVPTGRSVDEGDHIITIYDENRLWVDLQAYPDQIAHLDEIRGLLLKAGRSSNSNHIDANQLEQVTAAGSSSDGIRQTLHIKPEDEITGMIPNQNLSARVYHSDFEEVLAVPEDAVFDQDAYEVVFVQNQGDRFEKRVVETGNRYQGWIEIREGLQKNERIVTRGVYPVYLEAGEVEIGDSHDH